MSFVLLVSEIKDAMIPSEPEYKVHVNYSTSIKFSKLGKPTTKSDLPIVRDLVAGIGEDRTGAGEHVIDTSSVESQVMQRICDELLEFLKLELKAANPRLTGIYKWYRTSMYRKMRANTDFANDMTELYKYLFYRDEIKTDVDVQNGVALMKLIYNKYRT